MIGEITVIDIMKSICDKLDSEFGFDVHIEEIEQGFEEPCFFVEIVATQERKIGHNRYKRGQPFCIHFYPKDSRNKKEDILDMAENLYSLLEYIGVRNDLCRGINMNHKELDEKLCFFVEYNYHLLRLPHPDPPMVKLKIKEELKNG